MRRIRPSEGLAAAAGFLLMIAALLAMCAIAAHGADPADVMELSRRQAASDFVARFNEWSDAEAQLPPHTFSLEQKNKWHAVVAAMKRLASAQRELGYD